jgi:hypothetical protein
MSEIQVTVAAPPNIKVTMGTASIQVAYNVQQGSLPAMPGHANQFLFTDGTSASWQPMDGGQF